MCVNGAVVFGYRAQKRFTVMKVSLHAFIGQILNGRCRDATTVPIGVINTPLLGCKKHRISTAINTAIVGDFTMQKERQIYTAVSC